VQSFIMPKGVSVDVTLIKSDDSCDHIFASPRAAAHSGELLRIEPGNSNDYRVRRLNEVSVIGRPSERWRCVARQGKPATAGIVPASRQSDLRRDGIRIRELPAKGSPSFSSGDRGRLAYLSPLALGTVRAAPARRINSAAKMGISSPDGVLAPRLIQGPQPWCREVINCDTASRAISMR
jgi:hypothetical protein